MTTFSCSITQHIVKKTENKYEWWGRKAWKVETDSSTMYWRKVGEGEKKIILVHGFGPVPQIQWKGLVEELYQEYTIYIPDMVYFGESTSSFHQFDPHFLARQIIDSFEGSNESFFLVGVSYGGFISSIIAEMYPEKVEGMILIDALTKYMDRNYADSLAANYGYETMAEILVPENGKSLKTLFKLTFYKPPKVPACALNKPAQQLYRFQRTEKEGLMQYLYSNEEAIRKWQFEYEGAVTIVWGKEDVLIPVEDAYLLKEQYKNAQVIVLENAAHAVNMEKAPEVAEIIRSFIGE